VGLLILFLSPYLVYFVLTKFKLFQFYFGESAVSIKNPIAWNILPMLGSFVHNIWFMSLVLGILTLLPILFGFDIFWKQKNKSLNADVFVVLWLLVHLFFYIVIFRAANDRWLLMLMPAIFLVAAKGIEAAHKILKPHSKYLALAILIILLFGGAYQNYNHAIDLTESKKESYLEVKQGGLWLKENTPKDSKIITSSIVQNQYYSERQSYDFYTNDSIWKSCLDLYGALSTNETCQRKTEEAFNKKIKEVGPAYLVVSIFEPTFTPNWAYTYPQRYNLTAVVAFPKNTNQPTLVVYKFN